MRGGWIGIDLDGTLAVEVVGGKATEIGAPVPAMVNLVKSLLAQGEEVRIFTAGVDGGTEAHLAGYDNGHEYADVESIREAIQRWSEIHVGQRLAVTNIKTCAMKAYFDDRAVQVIKNLGVVVEIRDAA